MLEGAHLETVVRNSHTKKWKGKEEPAWSLDIKCSGELDLGLGIS